MASCSMAAGRRVSSEAMSTRFLWLSRRKRPIFAVVVVLPEPCRPTSITAAGGLAAAIWISALSPPSISTRWSLTILMTCWPGATLFSTSAPTAFSRTPATKSLTTGSATSASSRAMRTSRSAASTSASLSAPRRVSVSKTPPNLPDRLSNTCRSRRPNEACAGARHSRTGVPPRRVACRTLSKRREPKPASSPGQGALIPDSTTATDAVEAVLEVPAKDFVF